MINHIREQAVGQNDLTMKKILALKPRAALENDTQISLKHNYIYSMVSKAASSTVTWHLQYAEYAGTKFKVLDVNDARTSPHIHPFQLPPDDLLAILSSDAFKRITFVRNPYSRLLSCYLHRIIGRGRQNPSKKVLMQASGRSDVTNMSFEDFVSIISDQPNFKMERHWCVQHDSILYPLLEYDFIGKQENLIPDLVRMEKIIFRREVFDREKLLSTNLAPMQTSASTKLRDHYSDAIMAKVADRFKIDFETFGYSTDLPE